MRLTVSKIHESGLEEELRLPIVLGDIALEGDVQVSLRALKFEDNVLIDGRINCTASLLCSRCLKEFSFPVKMHFNVEYVPLREYRKEHEHELTRPELDVNFYSNDEINIEDLVGEQILLVIPMKPLCDSECRGICPQCGKNLNETSCNCNTDKTDIRLEVLKKFKENFKNGKE